MNCGRDENKFDDADDWQRRWDARIAAMESILGKVADTVGHSVIPFQFGADKA